MREWAPDRVWIAEAPQRFFGVEFGTRMTVVRLRDGSLWVHSPIPLDEPLRRELDARGPVRWAISPNKLHHLYLADFARAYPQAELWASPGLPKKRRDLDFAGVVGDAPEAPWADSLEQAVVRGSFLMEEVVFLHGQSRTLIVADLCEHFGPWSPRLTRIVARLGRMYERPCMPPDWKRTFRDRAARRASFERILAWDFERVILAHGRLLESGAKALFEREYAWALGRPPRSRAACSGRAQYR